MVCAVVRTNKTLAVSKNLVLTVHSFSQPNYLQRGSLLDEMMCLERAHHAGDLCPDFLRRLGRVDLANDTCERSEENKQGPRVRYQVKRAQSIRIMQQFRTSGFVVCHNGNSLGVVRFQTRLECLRHRKIGAVLKTLQPKGMARPTRTANSSGDSPRAYRQRAASEAHR